MASLLRNFFIKHFLVYYVFLYIVNYTATAAGVETLRINLLLLNADNSTTYADGGSAQYSAVYSNNVDGNDGAKFSNPNENIALERQSQLLSIERRQIIGVTDTLFLKLWNTTSRNYQFRFIADGLDHPCLAGFLVDSYLNTSTPINLNDTTLLNFTVNTGVPTSKDAYRFKIVFKPGIVWTGALSSDWYNTGNWLGDVLPSATCGDALIPNTANKPLISAGIAIVRNLNIQAGASLTVKNATLQIGAAITNAGTLSTDSGTIELNGSIAQTVGANTFRNNDVKNLTISNTNPAGVTVSGPLNIYGRLSFGNGNNKVLASGGFINLRSTAAGTAMVADITSGNPANNNNRITGDVIVERYYPGRRAWRLVTAPVSTTRTIYNEWQIGGKMASSAPGSGTLITSPTGANGLDVSINYSMKTFNANTGALVNVNNTNVPISANARQFSIPDNIGYFLFVRGDRVKGLLNPYPITNYNNTTLRDTGILQTGMKTFGPIPSGKFMLIGNPYASPVDFGSLALTNVQRRFWAWDPRLNSTIGSYVYIDGLTGSYIVVPLPSDSSSGENQFIQSSQAFFVQASSVGSGTLTFNENNKAINDNNTVFRPALPADHTATYESLRCNLYLDDGGTFTLADGVYNQFNNRFSSGTDDLDALKFTNVLENLGIAKNGKIFMLERRPVVTGNDTIFFKLWNTTARNYQFRFTSTGINHPGLEGFLEDSYLQTSTPIKPGGNTSVNFTINADALSQVSNRFRIVFRSLVPLPLAFTAVTAYEQDSHIIVEWKMENEVNMKQYVVERSSAGQLFIKLTTIAAAKNNGSTAMYQWADVNAFEGNNYYRVRSVDLNGRVAYSKVIKVSTGKVKPGLMVYPNPVPAGKINLRLINQPKGMYLVKLINKLGQILLTKQIEHEAGSSTENLQIDKAIAHGAYKLELTRPGNIPIDVNVLY